MGSYFARLLCGELDKNATIMQDTIIDAVGKNLR